MNLNVCRVLEQKPKEQASQLAITPAVPSAPLQWPLAVPGIQGVSRPMAFQGCTFSNCTFQVVNSTATTDNNYTEDLSNIWHSGFSLSLVATLVTYALATIHKY